MNDPKVIWCGEFKFTIWKHGTVEVEFTEPYDDEPVTWLEMLEPSVMAAIGGVYLTLVFGQERKVEE